MRYKQLFIGQFLGRDGAPDAPGCNLSRHSPYSFYQSRISGQFPEADEPTNVAPLVMEQQVNQIKSGPLCISTSSIRVSMNGPFTCHIIYSMLLSQHACLIVSVGEIKVKEKFKSCHVLVKTKELRDEVTGDIVRASGTFDCEVNINDDERHKLLTAAVGQADNYLPCTFILRSFMYKEKDQEKLGKQLQLKRWWR